jgi:hypothetical protein
MMVLKNEFYCGRLTIVANVNLKTLNLYSILIISFIFTIP